MGGLAIITDINGYFVGSHPGSYCKKQGKNNKLDLRGAKILRNLEFLAVDKGGV